MKAVVVISRRMRIRRTSTAKVVANCWLLASSASFYSSCHGYLHPDFSPRRSTCNNKDGRFLMIHDPSWGCRFSSGSSTRLFSSVTSSHTAARRVCLLREEEEDSHTTHLARITDQLSKSMSLPIVTRSQLLLEMKHGTSFTHGLSVEDYPEGHFVLASDECYALAIQPLTGGPKTRKRRQQQQQDTSSSNNNDNKPLKKLPIKMNPFWIDLCPPTLGKRSGGQPDLLLQAVAPQRVVPGRGAHVMDLTAGWGQDSLLLAWGGASRVTMVERDPVVALVLQDALRRLNLLAQSSSTPTTTHDGNNNNNNKTVPSSSFPHHHSWQLRAQQLSQKLSLQVDDSRNVLHTITTMDQCPDIVYLDPMFPPRQKTAAVKKGMQILHGLFVEVHDNDYDNQTTLVGVTDLAELVIRQQAEEAELLLLAYEKARHKVVVKRPIHAPTLGGGGNNNTNLQPTHSVYGSINRWDIYLKT
jgi:16S rRNA (guanine1516-N2)-methyltransferase